MIMTAQVQTDVSSILKYKPVGITHIAIMAIVAAMLVFIDYILVAIGHATTTTDVGYITVGNIVVSVANAYWLIKLSINAQGIQETTAKP